MDIGASISMAILRREWENSRNELGAEADVMWGSVIFEFYTTLFTVPQGRLGDRGQ